ncbi:uncharacterized protein LOC143862002 isoform X3 [Tasmannia lanceolata]|uniref:uncharacterized protein LOC143862002 isoform X3 n=1 Tax=Tasmannia lanceolata TaxID=3420 RepID=UPI0040643753
MGRTSIRPFKTSPNAINQRFVIHFKNSWGLMTCLLHPHLNDIVVQQGYSSLLSFTVTDLNSTVTKLMALGAELDGSVKYEIHGKVAAMRCLDGHMLGLYEPV